MKTPYTSIYDEFPEETIDSVPEQLEEEHTTKSKIPSNPSYDPFNIERPNNGMHHIIEYDEPRPSSFLFEFEEDLFEDFGNASNLPVQVRPQMHSALSEIDEGPHNESFLTEHIKGLSAIMSHEWTSETELSSEVA